MSSKFHPRRLFVELLKAMVISLALLYLTEYFGWDLLREVGGGVVRAEAVRSSSLDLTR